MVDLIYLLLSRYRLLQLQTIYGLIMSHILSHIFQKNVELKTQHLAPKQREEQQGYNIFRQITHALKKATTSLTHRRKNQQGRNFVQNRVMALYKPK